VPAGTTFDNAVELTFRAIVAGNPLDNANGTIISSGYRLPGRHSHEGIDIQRIENGVNVAMGEAVFAAHGGEVLIANTSQTAGYWVVIRSDVIDPVTNLAIVSRYMHMQSHPLVLENARISQGTHIGFVGNSGQTSGSGPGGRSTGHLHLDFNNGNRNSGIAAFTINPQRFFPDVMFSGQTSTVMP